ncbi:MAG TPA: ion channel [Methylomirabilota bacterium]|nr:ion channel [Methylomirabilota bacterium]
MSAWLAWVAHVDGAHRYAVLFYTLLLTLAAAPLLHALRFDADVLRIFLVFSLLVALLGVPDHRWRLVFFLVVAVVLGLLLVPPSSVRLEIETGTCVLISVLALVAMASAIRFALRAPQIDAEHVYAALSAYLLAGLFFGVLHWTVALTWPGSLGEAGASGAPATVTLSTAIYYSFVTLATLGYGDIVPKTEVARGLAVLEAVGGQLYIAVTIARLVGARR